MSQIEEFENLIDNFNFSANVIRKHLASREANPTAGQGDNEPTDFPLASASEKVRDAHKAMLESMAQIQRIFVDPIELNSQTIINVSDLPLQAYSSRTNTKFSICEVPKPVLPAMDRALQHPGPRAAGSPRVIPHGCPGRQGPRAAAPPGYPHGHDKRYLQSTIVKHARTHTAVCAIRHQPVIPRYSCVPNRNHSSCRNEND